MGRGNKHPLTTAAGNIGYAASFWIFPGSYRIYRIQKRLFNVVFQRDTPVIGEPRYAANTVVIQGFRHSGNLFIESNVAAEDQHRIPQVRHRPWIIKAAVTRGLTVVVLVRHPGDVAASTFYRTTEFVHPEHPFCIFPWAVLCAWIGYHRTVMRFRQSLVVLPFELVANDYPACRRTIEDRAGIRMNADPDFARINRYGGERWELELSWPSQFLLRKAEATYNLLVASSGQAGLPAASPNLGR